MILSFQKYEGISYYYISPLSTNSIKAERFINPKYLYILTKMEDKGK